MRRVLALAAAVLLAGASPAVVGTTAAGADPISSCSASTGTIIAVDFTHFGGPIVSGCDLATGRTGIQLLNDEGFVTSGDQHDGPQFICRIGNSAYNSGTQYPTPAQDPCIVTPPATAYWSYWLAKPGDTTWTYSQWGAYATEQKTTPGMVQLWIFGGTHIKGSQGDPTDGFPTCTPDSLRGAGGAQSCTPGSTGGTSGGSGGSGSGNGTTSPPVTGSGGSGTAGTGTGGTAGGGGPTPGATGTGTSSSTPGTTGGHTATTATLQSMALPASYSGATAAAWPPTAGKEFALAVGVKPAAASGSVRFATVRPATRTAKESLLTVPGCLSIPLHAGVARCALSLPAGRSVVRAIYSGSATYRSAVATLTVTVRSPAAAAPRGNVVQARPASEIKTDHGSPWPLILGIGLAVVLLGGGSLVALRRRRAAD